MIIYTVDAFTNKPFKGNPAGVCIVDQMPHEALMQNIATELSYSNTAFVEKVADAHYKIRWFTPHSEAPLCGHATIGSMHILCSVYGVENESSVKFESKAGEIYAKKSSSWYELNFPSYEVSPVDLSVQLQDVINVRPIYTGFAENCYFMEFESLDDLKALAPDLEKLKRIECRALSATAQGVEFDFHSRYFAPRVGINEDPVCASAHTRLIPYWAKKLGKDEMIAHQASARGGILKCKNLGNRVLISGEAVTVMRTELNI